MTDEEFLVANNIPHVESILECGCVVFNDESALACDAHFSTANPRDCSNAAWIHKSDGYLKHKHDAWLGSDLRVSEGL